MIQQGTILHITDNSGIILGQCIKVIGITSKRIAFLEDVVLISVVSFKKIVFSYDRKKKVKQYRKGDVFRALIVRVKKNYIRAYSFHLKFDINSAIIVNKTCVPISNRIYGPIFREFCVNRPSIGCITRYII